MALRSITDWFQNQLLGSILSTLGEHTRQIRSLEESMGALDDTIQSFRADVDAETTRISALLSPVIARLRALGTGGAEDPIPAPGDGDGGPVPSV